MHEKERQTERQRQVGREVIKGEMHEKATHKTENEEFNKSSLLNICS